MCQKKFEQRYKSFYCILFLELRKSFKLMLKKAKKKKNCVGGDVGKKWDGSLRETELNVWTYH